MSKHFASKYKYSHARRLNQLMGMVKCGSAKIVFKDKAGWLFETTNGKNYRVSNRGNLVEVNK